MISHHVFVGERLMAFSDAVFSIVATIMVSYNISLCVEYPSDHNHQVIPLKLEENKINEVRQSYHYLLQYIT